MLIILGFGCKTEMTLVAEKRLKEGDPLGKNRSKSRRPMVKRSRLENYFIDICGQTIDVGAFVPIFYSPPRPLDVIDA